MKVIECNRCGSSELVERGGYAVCAFCHSQFMLQSEDMSTSPTTISLMSDIELLLKKCEDDPLNRRRYASLILDIDPTNKQAIQYLR